MIQQKIANQWAKLKRIWRIRKAGRIGVRLGRDALLGPMLSFRLGQRNGKSGTISIGDHAWIEQGVMLHAYGGVIDIARSVFIGPYAIIYGHGDVTVGEETLISMHCCILSSNHAVPGPAENIRRQPDVLMATRIGRDVWLGAGVKVLAGVTIGDGCVVGAGAVVVSDLPPNSIAVGIPAKVVKNRL